LQGLVVAMAIGATVDRPAFTNWKYRDAFADTAAFALSDQKVRATEFRGLGESENALAFNTSVDVSIKA
jgi:hypothetical protein